MPKNKKKSRMKSDHCDQLFTKSKAQRADRIIYNKEKCLVCEKKFHMPCEVCGKIYHSQAGLDVHLKLHTGEKPFTCEVCGKAYTNSAGLLYHQKTHTGEKNFSCETCGRGFSSHG
ncbi:Zinc finger protein, partial [Plakobranchus ocellatus]